MKVFKELVVAIPENRRGDFLSRVEKSLPSGWSRDREAESRIPGPEKEHNAYFVCQPQDNRPSALVALVPKSEQSLYVSNIVPREASQLTHEQYNRVLDEFANTCIAPIANQMDFTFTLTSDKATLETWVCAETAEKFRRFSALANKSTGSSHPCDKDRWYEFVISVVMNKDRLDASTLMRWLAEEDGWPQDIAHEMGIEFEQEVGLLEYYRDK